MWNCPLNFGTEIDRHLTTDAPPTLLQINSIFHVSGRMGPTCCKFHLDSGAVIRFDALDEKWHPDITAARPKIAIGADGLPLEVVGKVTLPVSLDHFQAQQEFS